MMTEGGGGRAMLPARLLVDISSCRICKGLLITGIGVGRDTRKREKKKRKN